MASEVAKRARGRPRTGFDKKAYDRDYHRNNRARIKAQKQASGGPKTT